MHSVMVVDTHSDEWLGWWIYDLKLFLKKKKSRKLNVCYRNKKTKSSVKWMNEFKSRL